MLAARGFREMALVSEFVRKYFPAAPVSAPIKKRHRMSQNVGPGHWPSPAKVIA
jgi:hypothetical protein